MPEQQALPDLTRTVLREVGPRLRAARLKRDLTLEALSDATGISASTLSRLEAGKRASPAAGNGCRHSPPFRHEPADRWICLRSMPSAPGRIFRIGQYPRSLGGMGRGRYAKGDERREEILSAAFEVLSRDGYRKASLAQIGRAIGIESAHVVYYFSSRDALLVEVLRRWDARNAEAPTIGTEPLAWWVESVKRNESHRGIVELYAGLTVEASDPAHPAHSYFAERFARIERDVSAELAGLQAAGSLPEDLDPTVATNQIIALSDGLNLRWLVDPSFDLSGAFRRAIDQVLAARMPTPSR